MHAQSMHFLPLPPRRALPLALVVSLLLALAGCGEDSKPVVSPGAVDAEIDTNTADLIGGTDLDSGSSDDQTGDDSDDATGADTGTDQGDVIASEVAQLNCPGTNGDPGCPCTSVQQCASNFCIDTPAGQQCAAICGGDSCPDAGFKCATVSGAGGDVVNICVPKFSKICDPCNTNQECQGPGNGSSRCVDQGDNGAFCAAACAVGDDCPEGYECQDVKDIAGAPSKQCLIKSGGACPCSEVAIKLQLSTKCFSVSGTNKCEGKRTCLPAGSPGAPTAGGLTACLAPKPTDESCNGLDDNCNGETDETTCDDKNLCTDDTCPGAAGCKNVNNALPCDDGSVCTNADVCKGGDCLSGPAVDCDDKNPCTTDSCDLAKGCTHTNAEAVPCDADDNACTQNDQCASGKCVPGLAKPCATDEPCLGGKCAIETGICGYTFQAGGPCNDGNACTTGESCIIDTCKGDIVKCDDGNACTGDSCEPKIGCVHALTTGICDDGNACTTSDTCDGKGGCVGIALNVTQTCDDFNGCTVDTCDVAKGCAHKNADGVACDDGNPCTSGDACKTGACAATTNTCDCAKDSDCDSKGDGNLCNGSLICDTSKLPYQCVIKASTVVKCDDSLNGACQNNACDPSTGKCKLIKKSDGLACDADGSVCTVGDACKDGACGSGPSQPCDDKNPCTDEACDDKVGCKYTPNAKPCDADSNPCTENDVCALGACVVGKGKACVSDDQCVDGKCSMVDGNCKYSFKNAFPCNDGSLCTLNDVCTVDTCQGTTANCDDGNPCTGDSCDGKSGCAHVNVTALCNDGNACTENDQCAGGACKGAAIDAAKCDDGNVCTADSCDAKLGCVHAATDGSCNDNNPCTTGDACQASKCVPGTNTCACNIDADCVSDGNLCNGKLFCDKTKLPYECTINPATVPKCDVSVNGACQTNACLPSTGKCMLTKQPNGLGCDADANACTAGDACLDGKCASGKVVVCDDSNPCTVDSCDAKNGCVYVNNLSPCDADSNACTQNDACSAGSCVAGKLKTCDDKEGCTTDSCDIKTGTCKYAPIVNKSCSDDSACTVGDACGNNPDTGTFTCVSGKAANCDDGNVCTAETCDPLAGCKIAADPSVKVPCYTGPAGTKNVGICKPGSQQCDLSGKLGACLGQTLPNALEICNAVDDNCDGVVDEGCKPTGVTATLGNASGGGTGSKYTLRALVGASSAVGTTANAKNSASLGFYQRMKKILGLP